MPDLWMPGVTRYDTGRRLTMRGGPRLFTWHTFEAPYTYSPDLRAATKYLASQKSDPHFVFHPITGALVQMLPANTGGRTLRAPGVNTNTHGTVHMQVEVIAYASRPWTQDLTPAGKQSLARLLGFLESWGIPSRWAHGVRPPKYPGPGVQRRQPAESGHFHHAGWVGNDHGDPGAIADPWKVTGSTTTPTPSKPPQEDVMTPEQEAKILTAIRELPSRLLAAKPDPKVGPRHERYQYHDVMSLLLYAADGGLGIPSQLANISTAVGKVTPERIAALIQPVIEDAVREAVPEQSADAIIDALARRLSQEEQS